MNDKQRAEFEEWCKSEGYCTIRSERYGNYIADYTDELWQSWQAAIASVVVKLPELEKHDRDAVTEKLEEAGIRYE